MTARPVRAGLDGALASSRRPTGVEHYAASLLTALAAREDPRLVLHLYLPPAAARPVAAPSVRVRVRPDVDTRIRLPWLIACTQWDRLDVLCNFSHLPPPRGVRGRFLGTVYDLAFLDHPECYPPGDAERLDREVAVLCGSAPGIITPSRATRDRLAERYGYPRDAVAVLGAGARAGFVPGEPGALPRVVREAGVRPPFVLCVGRLDPRKNLERVLEACRLLWREGSSLGGLVITGPDDSGAVRLREKVARGAAPGERVAVTGYVDEAELVSLYRAAALLAYPSLSEGFGLPVLEAMACGTPVVTSTVSSLPEVAGEAAVLVDPTDTAAVAAGIRSVLEGRVLAAALREAGPAQAARFTWEGAAQRFAEALWAVGSGANAFQGGVC